MSDEVVSLETVLADLRGFGIEECEQILTINAGGRAVNIRISNIPTEADIDAIIATDEYKGYPWIQRVKCEVLSRSISYLNGWNLRDLKDEASIVADPKDGKRKPYQVVLRNILLTWGIEVVAVLWKVLMVHAQKIEDRLVEDFPESAILTEVEKRLISQAMNEIDQANKNIIQETVADLYKEEGLELPTIEENKEE
jgi:hypothetical protein